MRGRPGHPISEETKEKIRQSKFGKKRVFTPEWIEKLRSAATGQKQSAETIAKRATKQIGNQRGKGYRHTDEAKRKIGAARRQRNVSPGV